MSTFDLSYQGADAKDPTVEAWSLTHAADLPTAELEALARGDRAELLHVAAACVITAILRARDEVRVRRVSRRGAGLDYHLEDSGGREMGVLSVLGTAGADPTGIVAEAVQHAAGAVIGPRIAGAVAFGGGKAAIRVLP